MVTKKVDPKKGKETKKVDKTKMVMKKVTSGGGSKGKAKKWSKGKVRDKLDNKVFLDQAEYDKAIKEIAKMSLVTPAVISEKFKLKVSVAKKLLRDLAESKTVKLVGKSSKSLICTKMAKDVPVA